MFRFKRQHPRIQVTLQVKVEGLDSVCDAISTEIGAGGMALLGAEQLPVSLPVRVSFLLPTGQAVALQAAVWWKEGKRIGLRFDLNDQCRTVIAAYVEQELAARSAAAGHATQ